MIIQGGCFCGAIRYQCSQKAVLQFNCYCQDCQKSTGAAYAPIAFFSVDAVTIEGEPKYFQSVGGSGQSIQRGFCANCGSQLFGLVEILPKLISIRAGTLDDSSMFQPKANIFTRQQAVWSQLDHRLISFDHNFTPKE